MEIAASPLKERLVSLDAFRGAVMALMVLVNTPGDGDHVYWPLQHAQWHGWTPTDVVFPSFLWIVGVAIVMSLGRRVESGMPRGPLLAQVCRRSAILFGLGLLLYTYPDFSLSTQRIMGVLQRIAICYLIASAIFLSSGIRGQILWIVGLLTGYWLLMAFAPVPGYGTGRLDVEGNFAHYVDRILLGAHNYRHTRTWDPEGFVSTLPAIATTLFGVLAGHLLRRRRLLSERTVWLFFIGNLLLAAGLLANFWMPVNKKLWTVSFSLFMAGLDFTIFAMFVWLVDFLDCKRAVKPLVIMGMNAIAIYLASEALDIILNMVGLRQPLYAHLFASWASPYNASALYAVAYVGLMWVIAWAMYRRGWFLRV
jgi:predicted acyltransferase